MTPVGDAGGGYATQRVKYAGDLFAEEALAFVEQHRERPFFLYLALVVPHANNERSRALGDGQEVPDYGIYADRDWHSSLKGQAAMITRMDRQIGDLLAKLKQLGIDERTLVVFSSDNGPHKEGGPQYDPDFLPGQRSAAGHQTQPDRRRHPRAVHRPLAGQDQAGRFGSRGLFRRFPGHGCRTGGRLAAGQPGQHQLGADAAGA